MLFEKLHKLAFHGIDGYYRVTHYSSYRLGGYVNLHLALADRYLQLRELGIAFLATRSPTTLFTDNATTDGT